MNSQPYEDVRCPPYSIILWCQNTCTSWMCTHHLGKYNLLSLVVIAKYQNQICLLGRKLYMGQSFIQNEEKQANDPQNIHDMNKSGIFEFLAAWWIKIRSLPHQKVLSDGVYKANRRKSLGSKAELWLISRPEWQLWFLHCCYTQGMPWCQVCTQALMQGRDRSSGHQWVAIFFLHMILSNKSFTERENLSFPFHILLLHSPPFGLNEDALNCSLLAIYFLFSPEF